MLFHLKEILVDVVQVSQESKLACCNKLHNPLVDNDAYVDSSDVSLAEYLCTHGCLIYVFAEETSVSLVVPRGLQ